MMNDWRGGRSHVPHAAWGATPRSVTNFCAGLGAPTAAVDEPASDRHTSRPGPVTTA